jgi:hypothetical protein
MSVLRVLTSPFRARASSHRATASLARAKACAAAAAAGLKVGKAAVAKASQRPAPVLKQIYENPMSSQLIAGLSLVKDATHAFYHSPKSTADLIKQAQKDPTGEGLLDNLSCQRGDPKAGIYGTGTADDTLDYTRAKYVVKIASPDSIHYDQVRGTFFLASWSKKHLMTVYEVANYEEQRQFVRPPLAQRAKIFKASSLEAFQRVYALQTANPLPPQVK